jgi:uncharacterized membrane protein
LRPILELADVYDAASLEQAFATARTYNTYSKTFVRGILEQEGVTLTASGEPMARDDGLLGRAAPLVHTDLGVYQRVLETVG